jgi:hypothetical protein
MNETTTPRRRWASALIATSVALPLLLGGAATAAWATTDDPADTTGTVDIPDAAAESAILPDPEDTPADEPTAVAPEAPTAIAAGPNDPQVASTDDPQPSPITVTLDVPDLKGQAAWYGEEIEVGISATSRLGASTTIVWSTTGAQVASGEAAGPRFTLPITAPGLTRITVQAFDDEGNGTEPTTHSVKLDLTTPIVDLLNPPERVYRVGDSYTPQPACEDPESGLALDGKWCDTKIGIRSLTQGQTYDFTEVGTFRVSVIALNNAWESTEVSYGTIRVVEDEDDAPTIDIQAPAPSAGWWNGPVEVTLVGDDGDGSGVARVEYRTFDGGVPGGWIAIDGTSGTFTTGGEGDNRYQVRAVDWFGNVGVAETVSFPTDATAPVVAVTGPDDGVTVEISDELALEFTCSDALSGLVSCGGTVDDGELLDTSETGTFEVVVRAVDRAGNETRVVRSYTVAAPDTTAPVVTFDAGTPEASGWFHVTPDVVIGATDADLRAIEWSVVGPHGRTFSGGEEGVASIRLPADLFGEGIWTLRATATDVAGNETDSEFVLRVDGIAPTVTIDAPANTTNSLVAVRDFAQGEVVPFEFTCSDGNSGIATCASSVGDVLPTDELGTFTVQAIAVDNAGHRTERTLEYTVVEAPTSGSGSGGDVPTLAQTGSTTAPMTALLALGMLAVGAAAAGSVIMVRRGR